MDSQTALTLAIISLQNTVLGLVKDERDMRLLLECIAALKELREREANRRK